jgi:glycosyltransferase involved in cell wall biosynthesis
VSAESDYQTAAATTTDWPSVTAVLPTRNRPELLARAVAAVLAQDYPGEINVIVVVDQADPDAELPSFDDPRVLVVTNERSPGLAGARNTGTLTATTDLIAFCDDDDTWRPGKLRAQVDALHRTPAASISTTAIEIDFDGKRTVRLLGSDTVTYDRLSRRRLVMLHSSSVVAWRSELTGDLGLQDERIPGHSTEDWDLQLRAASKGPIAHVDEPLVIVQWWPQSFFATDWNTKIAALTWMLDNHAGIRNTREGSARVYGQIGFAHASQGNRRQAVRWAMKTIGRRPIEPRAYLTLAVAAGVPPSAILRPLHKLGHGV